LKPYYFNKNFADCSLVITDYGMPQMSGIDLIKKIRELKRNDNIFNYYIHSSFLE
jgi:YesN/AraC family two-component response regulator